MNVKGEKWRSVDQYESKRKYKGRDKENKKKASNYDLE